MDKAELENLFKLLEDRKTCVNRAPVLFIIGCLCNYRFRSFKRFLIYVFHFLGYLDLRKKSANKYTDEELVILFDTVYPHKVPKPLLYELTGCSKNTFNKQMKYFFEEHKFVGRRTFTWYEFYQILNEWQGKGNWGMMDAVKKERLAQVISMGNYKKIADEAGMLFGDDIYKEQDKFSPKMVKDILIHIDLAETKEAENLIGYEKFKSMQLWGFGIFVLYDALTKTE